jgi:hypothetical protein
VIALLADEDLNRNIVRALIRRQRKSDSAMVNR